MKGEWLTITIGIILVNNFVLSKFLGICPFLGVSRKLDTALGMSGAVIFVMTLASVIASLIFNYILSSDISISLFGLTFEGNLAISPNLGFYSCDCLLGTNCGVGIAEVKSASIQCLGRISSLDYD